MFDFLTAEWIEAWDGILLVVGILMFGAFLYLSPNQGGDVDGKDFRTYMSLYFFLGLPGVAMVNTALFGLFPAGIAIFIAVIVFVVVAFLTVQLLRDNRDTHGALLVFVFLVLAAPLLLDIAFVTYFVARLYLAN